EDFLRLRLHRPLRLGQRAPGGPQPSTRGAAGQERLGADGPQAAATSESAAAVASTTGEQANYEQEDGCSDERHDHRANDRVAGDGDVEVEEAGKHDAPEQPADDADDDVPEQ